MRSPREYYKAATLLHTSFLPLARAPSRTKYRALRPRLCKQGGFLGRLFWVLDCSWMRYNSCWKSRSFQSFKRKLNSTLLFRYLGTGLKSNFDRNSSRKQASTSNLAIRSNKSAKIAAKLSRKERGIWHSVLQYKRRISFSKRSR